jgi:hypothetical protein
MASRLTAAMEEAYASNPSNVVFLHAFEIWGDGWSQPVFLVVGDEGNEAGIVSLYVEAREGRPAGWYDHTATALDVTPPGYDDDGPTEGKISIDGVSGELTEVLENAAVMAGTINVIYRNYRSDLRSEPGEVITGLKMKAATVTATRVEGTIGFDEVGSQAFPRATYDYDNYPGLYQAQV